MQTFISAWGPSDSSMTLHEMLAYKSRSFFLKTPAFKNQSTNPSLQLPLYRESWMKLLISTARRRAGADALKTCSGISLEHRYIQTPTL